MTMQAFYMNLTQVKVSGERKTKSSISKVAAPTAVAHDAYREKLARLTRLTLAELNENHEALGWSAWW